jgi:hypothetical protein
MYKELNARGKSIWIPKEGSATYVVGNGGLEKSEDLTKHHNALSKGDTLTISSDGKAVMVNVVLTARKRRVEKVAMPAGTDPSTFHDFNESPGIMLQLGDGAEHAHFSDPPEAIDCFLTSPVFDAEGKIISGSVDVRESAAGGGIIMQSLIINLKR